MKYDKKNRVRHGMKIYNKGNLPRIVVYRSGANIYAQMIQDGKTIAWANSLEKDFKFKGYNVEGAKEIGKKIGERAKKIGVSKCIFDRGSYIYSGRVAALADGAREFVEI